MIPLHELNEKMKSLKEWDLDVNTLVKIFAFSDSKKALEFAGKVNSLAEELNHYPDMLISKEVVKLSLITKSENMLTKKDFEMAEAIDRLEN